MGTCMDFLRSQLRSAYESCTDSTTPCRLNELIGARPRPRGHTSSDDLQSFRDPSWTPENSDAGHREFAEAAENLGAALQKST